jgi:transposase
MSLTARLDIHTGSHSITRLEIVETGRRWRRSENETLRIVEESLSIPQLPSATARRHGIANRRLRSWHEAYRERRLGNDPSRNYWL